jgi:UDP-N-acetylglucosamine 2-epimerase
MAKRRICVVVNSRANYGRIKSVLRAVKNHPNLDLELIVGASALLWRFGNVAEQIKVDGYSVDAVVDSNVEGEKPTNNLRT